MGRAFVLSSTKLSFLVVAASIGGFLLGRIISTRTNTASTNKPVGEGDGAFVLLVNMKFSSLAHRDTFLKLIEPVCKDVLENEGPSATAARTTLSYQVAISDKDNLRVVVMERYSDKDHGYLKVHRSGKEFLKFREQLKSMQESGDVVIEGESYLETDLGYV